MVRIWKWQAICKREIARIQERKVGDGKVNQIAWLIAGQRT